MLARGVPRRNSHSRGQPENKLTWGLGQNRPERPPGARCRRSDGLSAPHGRHHRPPRACASSLGRRRPNRRRKPRETTSADSKAAAPRALKARRRPGKSRPRPDRLLPQHAAARRQTQRHRACRGSHQAAAAAGCMQRRPRSTPGRRASPSQRLRRGQKWSTDRKPRIDETWAGGHGLRRT